MPAAHCLKARRQKPSNHQTEGGMMERVAYHDNQKGDGVEHGTHARKGGRTNKGLGG